MPEWEDLSDDELEARLLQRTHGTGPSLVLRLVQAREDEEAAALIDQMLNG
jgi:hypothetical protein